MSRANRKNALIGVITIIFVALFLVFMYPALVIGVEDTTEKTLSQELNETQRIAYSLESHVTDINEGNNEATLYLNDIESLEFEEITISKDQTEEFHIGDEIVNVTLVNIVNENEVHIIYEYSSTYGMGDNEEQLVQMSPLLFILASIFVMGIAIAMIIRGRY